MVAPGRQPSSAEFPGDVVIVDGTWQIGKTIYDVVDDLKSGDIILKGGNAFDPYGQVAVLVGNPQGGTVHAIMSAVYGRRIRLIVPIGLEKRVFEDINTLVKEVNAPGNTGLRLYPVPGDIFTELDAIEMLTGAEASLIAAGGIYGAEGSAYIGVSGSVGQENIATDLLRSLAVEPACEV